MVRYRTLSFVGTILVTSVLILAPLQAEEGPTASTTTREAVIENAGVAYGVTFGNIFYPGFKTATMILAAPQAGLAWLLTLGDNQQARTVWESHMDEPYFISSEQARKAMGVDEDSKPYERELTE